MVIGSNAGVEHQTQNPMFESWNISPVGTGREKLAGGKIKYCSLLCRVSYLYSLVKDCTNAAAYNANV